MGSIAKMYQDVEVTTEDDDLASFDFFALFCDFDAIVDIDVGGCACERFCYAVDLSELFSSY